jgi:hypothetical protein
MEHEMEECIEALPVPGKKPIETMKVEDVPRDTQMQIAQDSVSHRSKYGYALLWLLHAPVMPDDPAVTKTTAMERGVDFRIVELADSLHRFQPKAED